MFALLSKTRSRDNGAGESTFRGSGRFERKKKERRLRGEERGEDETACSGEKIV